ncbi:Alpha/beta hydrolase domain-containing protein 17A [Ananas comosus]|uniref:Alpha/beta hydrolase domain-containing protein 17A n=1 Tax=Ananas comosus TaxID=4615 RepID=A0A199UXL5_ANACO|nr:Alpha/beta hydrolase domain-containing protein 17A [Ananas comosus]
MRVASMSMSMSMSMSGGGGKGEGGGGRGEGEAEVRAVETRAGNRVVAAFWRHPGARLTVLYSHGNAADLGQMLHLFLELRAHLRVNIMRSAVRRPPARPWPFFFFCC